MKTRKKRCPHFIIGRRTLLCKKNLPRSIIKHSGSALSKSCAHRFNHSRETVYARVATLRMLNRAFALPFPTFLCHHMSPKRGPSQDSIIHRKNVLVWLPRQHVTMIKHARLSQMFVEGRSVFAKMSDECLDRYGVYDVIRDRCSFEPPTRPNNKRLHKR